MALEVVCCIRRHNKCPASNEGKSGYNYKEDISKLHRTSKGMVFLGSKILCSFQVIKSFHSIPLILADKTPRKRDKMIMTGLHASAIASSTYVRYPGNSGKVSEGSGINKKAQCRAKHARFVR